MIGAWWTVDPAATAVVLVAGAWYALRWRRARDEGRFAPVGRLVAFLAGCGVLLVAADSWIGSLDTVLLSVHMVQHMLLLLVAPPLLAAGAPVALALQTSRRTTRRRLLRVLHGRVVRVLTHPVTAAATVVAVVWLTHFTPVYDLALRVAVVHELEHGAYLVAGALLWWPVVGSDAAPRRVPDPALLGLLAVVGPFLALLGLVVFSADEPLFLTHALRTAAIGVDPLADQRVAGGVMWFLGPLVMLPAFLRVAWRWSRQDERRASALDRRLDAERAARRATDHGDDEGPTDGRDPVWWR